MLIAGICLSLKNKASRALVRWVSSRVLYSEDRVLPCKTCGRPSKFELRLSIRDGSGDYDYFFECPVGHMHSQRRDKNGTLRSTLQAKAAPEGDSDDNQKS
jgi:hypothetical protein